MSKAYHYQHTTQLIRGRLGGGDGFREAVNDRVRRGYFTAVSKQLNELQVVFDFEELEKRCRISKEQLKKLAYYAGNVEAYDRQVGENTAVIACQRLGIPVQHINDMPKVEADRLWLCHAINLLRAERHSLHERVGETPLAASELEKVFELSFGMDVSKCRVIAGEGAKWRGSEMYKVIASVDGHHFHNGPPTHDEIDICLSTYELQHTRWYSDIFWQRVEEAANNVGQSEATNMIIAARALVQANVKHFRKHPAKNIEEARASLAKQFRWPSVSPVDSLLATFGLVPNAFVGTRLDPEEVLMTSEKIEDAVREVLCADGQH
jgi:hypothetical protein